MTIQRKSPKRIFIPKSEESFYCADSLGYLAPERNEHYNRIVVNDSFMEMWDIGYPVKNFMIVAK
jgi:hypothetical protein